MRQVDGGLDINQAIDFCGSGATKVPWIAWNHTRIGPQQCASAWREVTWKEATAVRKASGRPRSTGFKVSQVCFGARFRISLIICDYIYIQFIYTYSVYIYMYTYISCLSCYV
jgi:hypothetical protein